MGSKNKKTPALNELPRRDAYGSARFAGLDYADTGNCATGVNLGRLETPPRYIDHPPTRFRKARREEIPAQLGPVIFSKPETNTLICAPAGAGKGTTIIIPTLLQYRSSVFTIDPKGENTYVTYHQRAAMGQTIHILNPWSLHDLPSASINPLDLLDADDPEIVSNATFLADLCIIPSSEAKDPFWESSARALMRGLLLFITAYMPESQRHIGTLRELVTSSPTDLAETFDRMAASERFHGSLREAGNQFGGMEDRTLSNVLATVQAHTDFLTDPIVKRAMERSDFAFSELKEKPTTVYVIIPAYALGTQARWLRLMVGMALTSLERGPLFSDRTLFLLDEFAALGHLEKVQSGIATLRGFGVDMALVLQDLNQLRLHYPKGGDTIIANCAYKHFMGVSDKTTAEYISSILGAATVLVESTNKQGQGGSTTISPTGRPLKTLDELITQTAGTGCLVKASSPPIRTRQVPYFEEAGLKDMASPNPMRGN